MGKGLLGAGSTPTASGSPSSWWARLGFPQREGLFNPSPAPPPLYYYWFEVVTFGEQLWSVSNERRHRRCARPWRVKGTQGTHRLERPANLLGPTVTISAHPRILG